MVRYEIVDKTLSNLYAICDTVPEVCDFLHFFQSLGNNLDNYFVLFWNIERDFFDCSKDKKQNAKEFLEEHA